MISNLELIAKLESVVAELDERMRTLKWVDPKGRATLDAISSIEQTIEVLKVLGE